MKIFLVVFASFTGGNLCGLLGAFVTGPIGFLAGGVGSIVVLARQRR